MCRRCRKTRGRSEENRGELGGHLATITSDEEHAAVRQARAVGSGQSVWLGVSRTKPAAIGNGDGERGVTRMAKRASGNKSRAAPL